MLSYADDSVYLIKPIIVDNFVKSEVHFKTPKLVNIVA